MSIPELDEPLIIVPFWEGYTFDQRMAHRLDTFPDAVIYANARHCMFARTGEDWWWSGQGLTLRATYGIWGRDISHRNEVRHMTRFGGQSLWVRTLCCRFWVWMGSTLVKDDLFSVVIQKKETRYKLTTWNNHARRLLNFLPRVHQLTKEEAPRILASWH